jgi:hypothetical protein
MQKGSASSVGAFLFSPERRGKIAEKGSEEKNWRRRFRANSKDM